METLGKESCACGFVRMRVYVIMIDCGSQGLVSVCTPFLGRQKISHHDSFRDTE